MTFLKRIFLFQAFFPTHSRYNRPSQTLPKSVGLIDGTPSALLRVLFFIFSLIFRQEPSQSPLCHSKRKWPQVGWAIRAVSFLFSAPPSKAPKFCLWVLPGVMFPEVTTAPPTKAQLPYFWDTHLHFLQHLEELRRLKDTKGVGRERWGISKRSAEKTSSPIVWKLSPGLPQGQNPSESRKEIILFCLCRAGGPEHPTQQKKK